MERLNSVWAAINFTLLGLFAVFATLKLVGVIDWSWWGVSSPLLGFVGLFGVGCIILTVFFPASLESREPAPPTTHSPPVSTGTIPPPAEAYAPSGPAKAAMAVVAIVWFLRVTVPGWVNVGYPEWVTPASKWGAATLSVLVLAWELVSIGRHRNDQRSTPR